MNIMANIKAQSAARKYQKGEVEAAKQLYEEALKMGLNEPRSILSYSVLLLRGGEYQKARELLVQHQKNPMLNAENKKQLYVNYAVCMYKLGDHDKAIRVLESQHQKDPSGLVYQTLGYLYVATGDTDKAVSFNQEALEYDDEDPITLDNLGQAYYRVNKDKNKAKEYFEKALAQKPGQIDTLYFLAQYDIEAGDQKAAAEKLQTALEGRFSPLNHATKEMIEEQLKTLKTEA